MQTAHGASVIGEPLEIGNVSTHLLDEICEYMDMAEPHSGENRAHVCFQVNIKVLDKVSDTMQMSLVYAEY